MNVAQRSQRSAMSVARDHPWRVALACVVLVAALFAETSAARSRATAAPSAAPPSPYSYDCGDSEPQCVRNFNNNLSKIRGEKSVHIIRVTVEGRDTPSMGEIKSNVRQLNGFFDTASRGQLHVKVTSERTVEVDSKQCTKAKNQALAKADSNAFLVVVSMPRGVCDYSNAGRNHIFLNGSLFRDYAHETGHLLGLGHGNRNINGDFDSYGDASTYMGSMPSDNYNIAQLHWLGWTKKDEIVKVNNAVDAGSSVEVTVRPVDRNAETDSNLPLGAVYEIPGTEQRLFISVPKSRTTNVNRIDGGDVFVYRAPKCRGCTGMSMGTTVVGRFGPATSKDHDVWGVVINPVRYEREPIRVDGQTVQKYKSITLRISKAAA